MTLIEGKNGWEFSCSWYNPDQIARGIQRDPSDIPTDIMSREFADWLTDQYRLAMRKGIELGSKAERARLAALESAAKEVERDLRELHRVCAVSPVIVDSADRLRDALTSEANDG